MRQAYSLSRNRGHVLQLRYGRQALAWFEPFVEACLSFEPPLDQVAVTLLHPGIAVTIMSESGLCARRTARFPELGLSDELQLKVRLQGLILSHPACRSLDSRKRASLPIAQLMRSTEGRRVSLQVH